MARDIDDPDRPALDEVRPLFEAAREPELPAPSQARETVEVRGYRYQISRRELDTLFEVGRFRTIALQDLARHQYQSRTREMGADVASLRSQGLVEQRTVWAISKGSRGEKLTVLVLTKTGKEVLERHGRQGAAQKLFAGFVKPAEVRHDAAIYRMYQLEAEKIRRSGGRIRRIVLDFELKQTVYAPLAKARALPPLEYAKRQAEIADQNRLKVVRGKILLPDLRIEYEAQSGERAHVDLELATDHYRGAHMRGKAEAGFKFYAPRGSVGGLSRAFDPEFVAEIFSL